MNLGSLFLPFLLLASSIGEVGVTIPIDEPHRRIIERLSSEIQEAFQRFKQCVMSTLGDHPLMTGTQIESDCVGARFSIIEHVFKLKMKIMKNSLEVYFEKRFAPLKEKYSEEVNYFFRLFTMFSSKSFWLTESFDLSQSGAKFFVNQEFYADLLVSIRPQLDEITEFQKKMVKEKLELIALLDKLLRKRDADLLLLFNKKMKKKAELEAEHALNKTKSTPEQIEDLGKDIKKSIEEEEEEDNGNAESFEDDREHEEEEEPEEDEDEESEDHDADHSHEDHGHGDHHGHGHGYGYGYGKKKGKEKDDFFDYEKDLDKIGENDGEIDEELIF